MKNMYEPAQSVLVGDKGLNELAQSRDNNLYILVEIIGCRYYPEKYARR